MTFQGCTTEDTSEGHVRTFQLFFVPRRFFENFPPPTLSPPSLPFSFLRFLSSSCFSSPTPLQLQFSFALLGHYSCRCGMSPRSNWFMNANIRRRWNHNEPYRGYTSCFKNGTPTRKAQQHWKKNGFESSFLTIKEGNDRISRLIATRWTGEINQW